MADYVKMELQRSVEAELPEADEGATCSAGGRRRFLAGPIVGALVRALGRQLQQPRPRLQLAPLGLAACSMAPPASTRCP